MENLLIKFGADWCGPCKIMNPVFDELEKEYGKFIKFIRVDIDENKEMAKDFNIRAIPTFVFVKGNTIMDAVVGVIPKNKLIYRIEKIIVSLDEDETLKDTLEL